MELTEVTEMKLTEVTKMMYFGTMWWIEEDKIMLVLKGNSQYIDNRNKNGLLQLF